MDEMVYEDPFCTPERPIQLSFQDITSASFQIKHGIVDTPCIVSNKFFLITKFNVKNFFLINCKLNL